MTIRRPPRVPTSSLAPEAAFEQPLGPTTVSMYTLAARRYMHEYGTTSAQLAAIKVAASRHAQHNQLAMLPRPVTVAEVLDSPMISDPLHRLDCCVTCNGGGALVVVAPEVAASLPRQTVKVLGHGESPKLAANGRIDLTYTARCGPDRGPSLRSRRPVHRVRRARLARLIGSAGDGSSEAASQLR